MRFVPQTNPVELMLRFDQEFAFLSPLEMKSCSCYAGASSGMGSYCDIFQRAEVREQANMLKGSAHAEPRNIVRLQPADRRTQKANLASRCTQFAGDQIEHRALAGAIGTQQSQDLA